jgi:hypothetical protein
MDSPDRVHKQNKTMTYEMVLTMSLFGVLVVSFGPLCLLSSDGQTDSHTRSHVGMNEHSSNQQSDQGRAHKQMLDTNAFSDLSRNTTSSGLKTGENTSRTG